jgi:hypothetical protein
MKKKLLILGIALILIAIVVGVAFAGYFGPCNSCPPGICERFTYSGEQNIGGRRLCKCGHTQTPHEWIND